MLDRTIAPAFVQSENIEIKEARKLTIQETPIHLLKAGTQKIIKIEFVFNAGKWFETHNGVAYFTANMLREGTRSHNSKAIAHLLDHYGAHLELSSTLDFAIISLYCLNKHLPELLPVIFEIISEPIFPEEPLSLMKEIEQQQLKIDLKKTKSKAQRLFRSTLYGTHNYGKSLEIEDIKLITSDLLKDHFDKNYKCYEIFISGQFDENVVLEMLEGYLGKCDNLKLHEEPFNPVYERKVINEDVEGSLQSSLRLGFPFVGKHHDDYIPFQILNHLFGGYFGSRLMKNIREDKGYTYGIYSSVAPLQHSSYYTIAADVVKTSADDAINEILKEMALQRNEEVPLDELETVKNHIMGSFQADITSPFALMDIYKSVYLHNMDYSYYKSYFKVLQEITPAQLQEIAGRYFREDNLTVIKVG